VANLPGQLQSALNRFKRGPVQLTIDPAGTPVNLYLASADITFGRNLIQGDHPIGGPYEVWTSVDQMRIEVAGLEEDSANIMNALLGTGTGYTQSATERGFGDTAGTALRANTKAVILRPWVDRALETTKVNIWKAFVDGDVTKAFGAESNEWTATLASLADETQKDGQLHGRITLPARS
jgi:hypothetical protein